MATTGSRYDTPQQQAITRTTPDSRSATTGTSSTTGTSTTNSSQNSTTKNFDPASQAALDLLIRQLMGGGTNEMARQTATRAGEVNAVQAQRAGYSKEAAFADAQGLISQTMEQALKAMLPSINNAALGAGTSQSSLRAILLQDAAQKAAQSSSVAGLGAATAYGGISANLSQVLEALTRPDNTVTQALLSALGLAKGGTVSNSTSGTSTTNNSSTTNSSQNNNTDYAPFGGSNSGSGGGVSTPNYGSIQFFGPQQTELEALIDNSAKSAGSTADLLKQLGGGNSFDSFTP